MRSSDWRPAIGKFLPQSSFFPRVSFLFPISLVLVLLCALGCQAPTISSGTPVQVVRVINGQTLEVTGMGETLRVRLAGIEAPDIQQQPWGQIAKQQLEAIVGGKTAILELAGQPDRFGRQWAYVWQNGSLLNEQLLKEGYVLWNGRSHDQKYDDRLEQAQAWGRIMGRGIWNEKQPMRQTAGEFRQSMDR